MSRANLPRTRIRGHEALVTLYNDIKDLRYVTAWGAGPKWAAGQKGREWRQEQGLGEGGGRGRTRAHRCEEGETKHKACEGKRERLGDVNATQIVV